MHSSIVAWFSLRWLDPQILYLSLQLLRLHGCHTKAEQNRQRVFNKDYMNLMPQIGNNQGKSSRKYIYIYTRGFTTIGGNSSRVPSLSTNGNQSKTRTITPSTQTVQDGVGRSKWTPTKIITIPQRVKEETLLPNQTSKSSNSQLIPCP